MADIKLDPREMALWYEVGSRGDAFREATRDRAFEQVRLSRRMTEIIDDSGGMLDSISLHEPVLEAADRPRTVASRHADRNEWRNQERWEGEGGALRERQATWRRD